MKIKVKGKDSFLMIHLRKGATYNSQRLGGYAHNLYCAGQSVWIPRVQDSSTNFKRVTCIKCLERYMGELEYNKRLCKEEIKFQRGKFLTQQQDALSKIQVPVTVMETLGLEL